MTAANAQVEKALSEARDSGRFMVAIWMTAEDGSLICRRTTWQFPADRFAEAIEQLNRMLEEERHPPKGPLPLARFLNKRPVLEPTPPFEMDGLFKKDEKLGGDLCDE